MNSALRSLQKTLRICVYTFSETRALILFKNVKKLLLIRSVLIIP